MCLRYRLGCIFLWLKGEAVCGGVVAWGGLVFFNWWDGSLYFVKEWFELRMCGLGI
jgi:hypothetical protein